MIILNEKVLREENSAQVKIEYQIAPHDFTYKLAWVRGFYLGIMIGLGLGLFLMTE